jgi:hypothetical protein
VNPGSNHFAFKCPNITEHMIVYSKHRRHWTHQGNVEFKIHKLHLLSTTTPASKDRLISSMQQKKDSSLAILVFFSFNTTPLHAIRPLKHLRAILIRAKRITDLSYLNIHIRQPRDLSLTSKVLSIPSISSVSSSASAHVRVSSSSSARSGDIALVQCRVERIARLGAYLRKIWASEGSSELSSHRDEGSNSRLDWVRVGSNGWLCRVTRIGERWERTPSGLTGRLLCASILALRTGGHDRV